ncbi:TonB-dependent receptor domain-containing protein [Paraglaciecola sp. MB-3u-78]|jgi:outer membrane receptor protein involved in Fe transport|uniref:TonB-dependent receptor domain-containing protein n=1 Tax=Paraglaciecola sp. MB-3u-78 TaxID=2058332 RepID=UPI000C33189F|nr:TonB-dependent receptor [Paraglaciecola sp. MB-3u-78]PKH00009.1 hypothetical protein CXF95_05005 [Paraglaciecola sp. MB-3u-78]
MFKKDYSPNQDNKISFVQSFEFSGAYRIQDFTTNVPAGFDNRTTDADVYQASLKWGVNNDLAIRATLASAFRNPSINELFQPEQQSFINGADPCDSRTVGLGPNPSVRKANCESLGIDTTTFVSDIQDGTISGGLISGNPDLEPETNDSYSIGLIYTPDYVEGLQIAVDYYNLEIEDFLVSHRMRWQDAVKIDSLDQTLYSANYTEDADGVYSGSFGNKTDARFIHDLSVSYTITESASVQVNLQNLLDRKPDGAGTIGFAAGHFGLDERLGRRFSVRFNAKF